MAAEPAPLFDTIETRALAQEPIPTPKRGRGRPPKLDPATGERVNAPRTPRKPTTPRKRTAARPRGPRSLQPEIAALLTMANAVIVLSPLGTRPVEAIADPSITPERVGDELDAAEIAALAGAIDAQCRRSPRFRRYVESVLGVGSGGALVTVVAMIAARRAARHGILPPMIDPMLGMAMGSDGLAALAAMPAPPPSEPDPETGETPPKPLPFDYETDGGAMEP